MIIGEFILGHTMVGKELIVESALFQDKLIMEECHVDRILAEIRSGT